uniref:Multidrug resistance protein, MATE family n=1 Tax=Candidatus Kentrum sp. FW TaxID=2126338 RepID=A0A450TBM2_9GAMM|nr:MAG: multidrug resistance protein, MATE family [Candidatus Kentron sp. FW]
MPSERAPKRGLPTVSELGAIIKTSLLLGIGYLGEMTIGITDIIMIGRLGADALGAAGLAASIYNIILLAGIGMSFPTMILVSQARGVARSRTVPGIIRQGLWIAGLLSIPSWAILWNLETILILTGQNPDLARMASHYMDYYLWSIFPAFTTLTFTYAFVGMDRGGIIVFVVWSEAGLNIILDYVLIFGKFGFPAMGMAGAGLASIMVYGAGHSIFFGILAFHRFFRSAIVFRRAWRPRWGILGQFLRLGWPKSLELLMEVGIFSAIALLTGWIGVEAIAAHTIAYQLYVAITVTVSIAVGNTVTSRISLAKGGGDSTTIPRIFNSGLLIIFLFMLSTMVALKLFSPWVVTLFVGGEPKAQPLVSLASSLVVLVGIFMLIDGLRTVVSHALNGLSDMKVPALITISSYWGIAFPCGLMLVFAMDSGVSGFWFGLIIGVSAATILCLMRFRWVVRDFQSTIETD